MNQVTIGRGWFPNVLMLRFHLLGTAVAVSYCWLLLVIVDRVNIN